MCAYYRTLTKPVLLKLDAGPFGRRNAVCQGRRNAVCQHTRRVRAESSNKKKRWKTLWATQCSLPAYAQNPQRSWTPRTPDAFARARAHAPPPRASIFPKSSCLKRNYNFVQKNLLFFCVFILPKYVILKICTASRALCTPLGDCGDEAPKGAHSSKRIHSMRELSGHILRESFSKRTHSMRKF